MRTKTKKILCMAVVLTFIMTFMSNIYTVSAATNTLLKKGMKNDEVFKLQEKLYDLGYLEVKPTGLYGDLTVDAVISFQQQYGLDPDGIAGPQVINLLEDKAAVPVAERVKKIDEDTVWEVQKKLVSLGFLETAPTGFYGDLTIQAVRRFQRRMGIEPDGIAGPQTLAALRSSNAASRGSTNSSFSYTWSRASEIFTIGTIATVYDINTGISFRIKRTYGTSHADVETLTADDTAKMKQVYGGEWSWDRRAIIITVNGRKMAASMNGMPHAGLDKYEANTYVRGRSGGYGAGTNLDSVKGNNMNGVFCIHFVNSRTHGTNVVDSQHQNAIKRAIRWAEDNY